MSLCLSVHGAQACLECTIFIQRVDTIDRNFYRDAILDALLLLLLREKITAFVRVYHRDSRRNWSCGSLDVSGILCKSFIQIRVTVCLYGQGEGNAVGVVVGRPLLHPGPGVRRVRGEGGRRPDNTGL